MNEHVNTLIYLTCVDLLNINYCSSLMQLTVVFVPSNEDKNNYNYNSNKNNKRERVILLTTGIITIALVTRYE